MYYEDMNGLAKKYINAVKNHTEILNGEFENFCFEIFEDLTTLLNEAILMKNSVFDYREHIANGDLLILRVYDKSDKEKQPYAHFGILVKEEKYKFWQLKGIENIPADDNIKKIVKYYCEQKEIAIDETNPDLI